MTTSCPGGDKAANLNFSARLRRAQRHTADSRSYSPPTHPKFTPAMIWEVEIVTKTRYDGFWRNIIFLKILFFLAGGGYPDPWTGCGTRPFRAELLWYETSSKLQRYSLNKLRYSIAPFTDIRHALVKCIEFHYKFQFLLAVFTI